MTKVKTPSEIMRELMDYYADPSADQVLFSHNETVARQNLSEDEISEKRGKITKMGDVFRSGAKKDQLNKIDALADIMLAKWEKWIISRDPETGKKNGKDEDSYNKFVSAMGFSDAVVAAAAKGKKIDKPEPKADPAVGAKQAVKDNPNFAKATESLEEANLMELFDGKYKKALRNLAARAIEMEKIPGVDVPAGEIKLDVKAADAGTIEKGTEFNVRGRQFQWSGNQWIESKGKDSFGEIDYGISGNISSKDQKKLTALYKKHDGKDVSGNVKGGTDKGAEQEQVKQGAEPDKSEEPVQDYTGMVKVDEIEKIAVSQLGLNKDNIQNVYGAIGGMDLNDAKKSLKDAYIKDVFAKLGLAMLLKAEKKDR